MRITMEQVKKWNAKLSNGFRMDVERCIVWNDKVAVKFVELQNGCRIKAEIGYREVYGDGPAWRRELLGVRPYLTVSHWSPASTDGMWMSRGMGAEVKITEQLYSKRMWNELAKFTADWTDEKILETAAEHMAELRNEYIVA